MERFQIVEVAENCAHAGTKAPADVAEVAERQGFQPLTVKMCTLEKSYAGMVKRQIAYYRDWINVEKTISSNSVVLLQHPFHYKQLNRESVLRKLKKTKHVRFISLVHDVEKLREYRFNDYYAQEFKVMLELADVIIVHNRVMMEWFISQGVDAERLVSLEIFDYLQEKNADKKLLFEKSITIAGHLDIQKCGYLGQLGRLKGVQVHLYGPDCAEELKAAENVTYHGSYPTDEIPGRLDRGFGLVWDGSSLCGCQGPSGQYLRYNNPHKLSLYLSAKLPVVIWKEAAEAAFVRENQVGILAEDLEQLPELLADMDEEKYHSMTEHVKQISDRLCEGYYTEQALRLALKRITDEYGE